MCGIVGWSGKTIDLKLARQMRDRLTHRGPDDAGDWWQPDQGIWLGQRRLAILDLSKDGHQPMLSNNGRYVLTYNGEVYNHKDLRRELEAVGYCFKGHSDTEVILAAIETWGLNTALPRFNGMFAFGLYDRRESCLWLVRDRMGIKPLYYAYQNGEFAFASELRALTVLPWLNREIDRDALYAYFRYLCVPAPATIFRGAKKLCPGTILCWGNTGIRITSYWSLEEVIQQGLENPLNCSFSEAADELETLLRDAVKQRMIADVPLGAFLSGGVDSSLVVAIMQSISSKQIKTFSIGFNESAFDESRYASAIASYLETDHYEQTLDAPQVLKQLPQILAHQDEPFADNSYIPTFILSQFAREQVTVTLSGDGGDEIFGGYPRYFWATRIEHWQKMLTFPIARQFGKALNSIPAKFWDNLIAPLGGYRFAGSEGLAYRVRRLGGYLACTPDKVYEEMVAVWKHPEEFLGYYPSEQLGPNMKDFPYGLWAEQMMATDQANYLVDDILTKVDRTSMAVALEVRVPLLDHRLVEWSWRIPLAYKLASKGDRGKLLLREVLYRYVPKHLIERPKMGFGMPLSKWLEDKELAESEKYLNQKFSSMNSMNNRNSNYFLRQYARKDTCSPSAFWALLTFARWHQFSSQKL